MGHSALVIYVDMVKRILSNGFHITQVYSLHLQIFQEKCCDYSDGAETCMKSKITQTTQPLCKASTEKENRAQMKTKNGIVARY